MPHDCYAEPGPASTDDAHHKSLRSVVPAPEFYSLFRPEQVTDIVHSIAQRREIPTQYNYVGVGATHWDAYANWMAHQDTPNAVNSAIRLIHGNEARLDDLLSPGQTVRIVDIGPGNALTVRGLIARLLDRKILDRYVAVDISAQMLEIAERNVTAWFDHRVPVELHQGDFCRDGIAGLYNGSTSGRTSSQSTRNLVLLTGGTLYNFPSPDEVLQNLYNSMRPSDLLLCTVKVDTDSSRRHINLGPGGQAGRLMLNHRVVLDLLNIDESDYVVHQGFREFRRERFVEIRFTRPIVIDFGGAGAGTPSVTIGTQERLLLWRYRHYDAADVLHQFERNGFTIRGADLSASREQLLVVADRRPTGTPAPDRGEGLSDAIARAHVTCHRDEPPCRSCAT
jgi:SAM-dependent methyltransferase